MLSDLPLDILAILMIWPGRLPLTASLRMLQTLTKTMARFDTQMKSLPIDFTSRKWLVPRQELHPVVEASALRHANKASHY